jgi:hypothetical protein
LYLGVLFVVLVVVAPGGLAAGALRLGRWAGAARWPRHRVDWVDGARRALAWLAWGAVIGTAVVAVEMLYFWQLSSSQGTLMHWWPGHAWSWSVDVAAPRNWWRLTALAGVALALALWLRPRRSVGA